MVLAATVAASLAGLALGSCTPAPAAPAAGAAGTILSLNPCTDAMLAALADPAQVAALSSFSRDPAQTSMDLGLARGLPSTHGTLEEIVARRPALVVASTMIPPATRAALARLGIPLAEFPIAASVSESESQVRRMARLAGHPQRGEALVAAMESALAAAAPPPGHRPIPALVWQGGGMVAGPRTLIADLLARTGFANFGAARGYAQAQILPLERVVADPPALVLVTGQDRMLAHPALAHLAGTRRMALDPSLEWCGGPTVIRAARRLGEVRRAMEGSITPGGEPPARFHPS